MGLTTRDELDELLHLHMNEKGYDTPKNEVKYLLEQTLNKPIGDFDSSIIKIRNKQYYMCSLSEKAEQDINK